MYFRFIGGSGGGVGGTYTGGGVASATTGGPLGSGDGGVDAGLGGGIVGIGLGEDDLPVRGARHGVDGDLPEVALLLELVQRLRVAALVRVELVDDVAEEEQVLGERRLLGPQDGGLVVGQ